MNARLPRFSRRFSSRWSLAALLALSLFSVSKSAFAQQAEEEAGDVSEVDKDRAGPLRNRVPPVSGHLFLMANRFEVGVNIGFSVIDAFYSKYIPGITLTYHFGEQLALALHGNYAFDTVAGTAEICGNGVTSTLGCRQPSLDTLDGANAFGKLGLMVNLDLQWSPIYGKLGLVAEKFISFNMYAALGPTLLMYGPQNSLTAGGNVAIGFRWIVNGFIAVRTEIRDVVYYEKFGSAALQHSLRNQLIFNLGLSFFVPTTFDRE